MTWSVPHVSQGRGPEETNGGMANNRSPWGWSHTNNGTASGGGGHLILLKFVLPNHEI